MKLSIKIKFIKFIIILSKYYSITMNKARILLKKCYLFFKKLTLGREDYDEWFERVTRFDRTAYREMQKELFTPQEW